MSCRIQNIIFTVELLAISLIGLTKKKKKGISIVILEVETSNNSIAPMVMHLSSLISISP